jgi:hypothetical protein
MPVSAADIEQVRTLAATLPDHERQDLSALETPAAVIGYIIACARAQGADEVEWAELLIRAGEMSPDEVRSYERTLRRLGYVQVADMMRGLAGRRKHALKPLI